MTFMAYLDVERQAVAESQQLCAVELTAFCELETCMNDFYA